MSNFQDHHIGPQNVLPGGNNVHAIWSQISGAGIPVNIDSPAWNIQALPDNHGSDVFLRHMGSHDGYTDWYANQLTNIMNSNVGNPEGMARGVAGLNNVIKVTIADPNVQVTLDGNRADVFASWDSALSYDSYSGSAAFTLGSNHGVNIAVAVKSDGNVLWGQMVPGESATNSFDLNRTLEQQQDYFNQLNTDLNELLRTVQENGFDANNAADVRTLQMKVEALASGTELSEVSQVGKYIRYVTAAGTTAVIFSPGMALAATSAIDGLGKGSAIVDSVSLGLLAYGFKESGILPEDADLGDLVGLLRNSNIISPVLGALDNIAADVGKELLLSGIATALGVGLIWKGYEIYQSISGLRAAIEFADQQSDSRTLERINKLITRIEDIFGEDAEEVPSFVLIAAAIEETLGTEASNDVANALHAFILSNELQYHDSGRVEAIIDNKLNAGGLANVMEALSLVYDGDEAAMRTAIRDAILNDPRMVGNHLDTVLELLEDTGECFPAGTLVNMADGTSKPIEDIRSGDMVLTFAEDGKQSAGQVTRLFRGDTTEWIELSFEQNGQLKTLTATPGHQFFRQDGSFAPLAELLDAEGRVELVLSDGAIVSAEAKRHAYGSLDADGYEQATSVAFSGALALAPVPIDAWATYNFEVADTHTYVAEGVCVHNRCLGHYASDQLVQALINAGVIDETWTVVKADNGQNVIISPEGQLIDADTLGENVPFAQVLEVFNDVVNHVGQSVESVVSDTPEYLADALPQLFTALVNGQDFETAVEIYGANIVANMGVDLLSRIFGLERLDELDFPVNEHGQLQIPPGEVPRLFETEIGGAIKGMLVSAAVMHILSGRGISEADYGQLALNTSVRFVVVQALQTQDWATRGADNVQRFFDWGGFDGAAPQLTPAAQAGAAAAVSLLVDLFDGGIEDPLQAIGSAAIAAGTSFLTSSVLSMTVATAANGASVGLGTYLSTSLANAFGLAGSAVPIIGNIIGAIVGAVIGKLLGGLFGGLFSPPPPLFHTEQNDDGTITVSVTQHSGGYILNARNGYDDDLIGGHGHDGLVGSNGDNELHGQKGHDRAWGGAGDDLMTGGTGNDRMYGGNDHDTLVGGSGHDTLDGGDGNDLVVGGDGNDSLYGDSQEDHVTVDHSQRSSVQDLGAVGEPDPDEEDDGEAEAENEEENTFDPDETHNDTLLGGAGNDKIYAGRGDDFADGGYGDDVVLGQSGDDVLFGGAHNDRLEGGSGDDVVDGGAGNDKIYGGSGDDIVHGDKNVILRDSPVHEAIRTWLETIVPGKDDLKEELGINKAYDGVSNLNSAPFFGAYKLGELLLTKVSAVEAALVEKLEGEGNDIANSFMSWLSSNDRPLRNEINRGEFEFLASDYVAPMQVGAANTVGGILTNGMRNADGNFINSVVTTMAQAIPDAAPSGVSDEGLEIYEALKGAKSSVSELKSLLNGSDGWKYQSTLVAYATTSIADEANSSIRTLARNKTAAQLAEDSGPYANTIGNLARYAEALADRDGASIPGHLQTLLTALDAADASAALEATIETGSGALRNFAANLLLDNIISEAHDTPAPGQLLHTIGAGNDYIHLGSGDDVAHGGYGRDTVIGGSGNDTIYGDAQAVGVDEDGNAFSEASGGGADSILGGTGDDVVHAGGGANYVDGGDGDDNLTAGSGHDTILGGDGADIIDGGAGNDLIRGGDSGVVDEASFGFSGFDVINAGAGQDTVYGDAGQDMISGGDGNDYIEGGSGDDNLSGNAGVDTIKGGTGNDVLRGNEGNDTLYGENGNDTIYGGSDNDRLWGQDGHDQLRGETGHDKLYGGSGNDTLLGELGADTLSGGDGNDSLIGGGDNDYLRGESGNDSLYGGSGSDTLIADAGNDLVEGGSSADSIQGNDGRDTLLGDAGADTLHGGNDNDSLLGGDGNDVLNGNTGNDTVKGDDGNDLVRGNDGHDSLYGGDGNDTMDGGTGNDRLFGGEDQDLLRGGTGNDSLRGENGLDTLEGGDGNDTLLGNAGRDRLVAGNGNDKMYGGNDADTLITGRGTQHMDGGSGNDLYYIDLAGLRGTIVDGSGIDKIVLKAPYEPKDINLEKSGNDLIIRSRATPADFVKIVGQFANQPTIERIEFDAHDYSLDLTNVIIGTAGNDSITGTENDDIILGLEGDDILVGAGGDDFLDGGPGKDVLFGNAGKDKIFGSTEDDLLNGGENDDFLDDGEGNDMLIGGEGNDTFGITENAGDHDIIADFVRGTDKIDLATFGDQFVSLKQMQYFGTGFETTGTDALLTFDGGQTLLVEDLKHTALREVDFEFDLRAITGVTGTASNEIIKGTNAGETINGGRGFDIMTGRGGADVFKIGRHAGDIDTITDFNVSQDKIDLSAFTDYTTFDAFDVRQRGADVTISFGADQHLLLENVQKDDLSLNHFIFDTFEDRTGASRYDGAVYHDFRTDNVIEGETNLRNTDVTSASAGLSNAILNAAGADALANAVTSGYGNNASAQGTSLIGAGTISSNAGVQTGFSFSDTNNEYYKKSGCKKKLVRPENFYGKDGDDNLKGSHWSEKIYAKNGNDRVDAGSGNDSVYAGNGNDEVYGGVGNDSLWGGTGDDYIAGGSGNDKLWGENGNDKLHGGSGNDSVYGGNNNDQIWGNDGADHLAGDAGNDRLWGGNQNDKIYGGSGNDSGWGGANNDSIYGQDGHDYLNGQSGNDYIDGGNHNDYIKGEDGTDKLLGGNGNDDVHGGNHNDTIYGGAGNDELHGNNQNDFIDGGTGHDYVYGGNNNDTVKGGDGNDNVYGGSGNDTVYGGNDQDNLFGGDGADKLYGENGNDKLVGGNSADYLNGGSGNDWLNGDASNDTLSGGLGDDLLYGGDHHDSVVGGDGEDSLFGDSGNDTLSGGNHDDVVLGGDGNDSIVGGNGNDDAIGGIGNDTVHGGSGRDFVAGEAGSDSLTGGSGNDVVLGGQGGDTIHGQSGNDLLEAGSGNDYVEGDEGRDVIIGGSGENFIHGGSGADFLAGGSHADRMYGGSGSDLIGGFGGNDYIDGGTNGDVIDGGAGHDHLIGGQGADEIYGGANDDKIYGGSENDELFGDAGQDYVHGGNGADWIDGGSGNDSLLGGNHNDTIAGGSGADRLAGDGGNDVLIGGAGADLLYGGASSDVFDYDAISDSTKTHYDVIADFEKNRDKIDLRDLDVTYADLDFTAIDGDTQMTIRGTDFSLKILDQDSDLSASNFYF